MQPPSSFQQFQYRTKTLSTLARQVQVLPIDKARLETQRVWVAKDDVFLEGEWWNRGCWILFFLTLWDFRCLFPTCSSKPWAQRGYSWHASRSQCHGPQKPAPQTSSCSREVCAMQSRDCTSIREAFLNALDEKLKGIVSVEPTRFLNCLFNVNGIQVTLGGDLWQATDLFCQTS